MPKKLSAFLVGMVANNLDTLFTAVNNQGYLAKIF